MLNAYEQGGVTGPNGSALLKSLQGGMEAPEAVPGAADLSQYARRGGGGGGSALGSAASGAMTGGSLASVVPGIGTALGAGIGGAIGGIKGLMNKQASTAPTDFSVNDAKDAIGKQYQSSLGRDASPDEIMSQLAGQGLKQGDRYVGEKGLTSVLGQIGQSPEAQQYAARGTQPAPVADVVGPAAPVAAASGQFRMGGTDDTKYNDPTHAANSPKYAIAHALSNFDPRQGYTPEVMAALNGLGIGQFSANGDKLSVAGGSDKFNGMTNWDGIKGMHSDSPEWQFGVDSNLDAPQQGGGGGQQMPTSAGGYNLDPMLAGDPLAKIQAAISKQAGSGDNIRALMAQLGAQ